MLFKAQTFSRVETCTKLTKKCGKKLYGLYQKDIREVVNYELVYLMLTDTFQMTGKRGSIISDIGNTSCQTYCIYSLVVILCGYYLKRGCNQVGF